MKMETPEIPVGTMVRLITQNLDDEWIENPKIEESVGVVIDHKSDSSWISGHGPANFEMSLVSWDTGTIKWIYNNSLTTYGF